MKILFVGHHVPHYIHTNVYREKAIQELKHKLLFFNDRDYVIPGRIREWVNFLQKWDLDRINKKLIHVVHREKPELCLVMGTRLPLLVSKTVNEIKKTGSRIALWITDIPESKGFSLLEESAPFYDHVFYAGTELIEILQNIGVKTMSWLPFGCDPDYHRPVELTDEERKRYAKDVVFVGALYPSRWETLKELAEFEIGIWGPHWNKAIYGKTKKEYIKDIKINVFEWVKIYNAAKIVVVIHYQVVTTPCYQASPKVYEALACGCFVLVDDQKDVFSLFDDKKHLVRFENLPDLKEKIRYYLAHPEEREEIARRGRYEVLAHHTFRQRIKTLIETVCEK